jgi:hypothetical protein
MLSQYESLLRRAVWWKWHRHTTADVKCNVMLYAEDGQVRMWSDELCVAKLFRLTLQRHPPPSPKGVLAYRVLSDLQESVFVWKVSRLHPFVLPGK